MKKCAKLISKLDRKRARQFEKRRKTASPQGRNGSSERKAAKLPLTFPDSCRAIAAAPDILKLFAETITAEGVIGEDANAKLMYLVVTSRRFDKPHYKGINILAADSGPSLPQHPCRQLAARQRCVEAGATDTVLLADIGNGQQLIGLVAVAAIRHLRTNLASRAIRAGFVAIMAGHDTPPFLRASR